MTTESDLAYLRGVAEAGASAPLIGGRYLVLWGGLAAFTSVAHWTILTGIAPVGYAALPLLWLTFVIIGTAGSILFGRAMRSKPGAASIGNRVARAAWTAAGAGIFLYALGCFFAVTALDAPVWVFDTIMAIGWFGYAVAFAVTAALSGERWLYAPAWMSIAAAALSPAFFGRPELYLMLALVFVFAVFLPGLRMMRREPPGEA